jgi:hypothetical protein
MPDSESVAAYRTGYRETQIGPRYDGWLHFAFTLSMTGVTIVACASRLHDVSWRELITVPLTFLYANFAEYFGHRGPMHHPRRWLHIIFERHTRQHHRFFTDECMAFDSPRDFKAVLFPPVMVTFFLFVFGAPVALLLAWISTPNVAWLFALTGTAYFLNYELLHFAYHLPPQHVVSRLPGMRVLRRHHTLHHDQALMSNYHFNITYPVADWALGTLYRGKPPT